LADPWKPACRIYLTGQVAIETEEGLVRGNDFPSPQALLVFVFLVAGRRSSITAEQIAMALWRDGGRPRAWDGAVSAILSKVRSLLQRRLPRAELDISRRFGRVRMDLPTNTWVDVEVAASAIDEADGHLRAGRTQAAWAAANVAACIARDPVLAEQEGPWLEGMRVKLSAVAARALRTLSDVSLVNREGDLAVLHAQQLLELDPLRETSYCQVMRVYAALGDRGAALRVYALCRERLLDDLGTSPSAETEAVYLGILRA
jgi:DNA-binding SARP family transcriptional activator